MLSDYLTIDTIAFIGVFLGVLYRTVIPYLSKLKEDPDITFDKKYIVTLVISFLESIVVAMLIFESLPTAITTSVTASLAIFLASFAWGYTSNDIANTIVGSSSGNKEVKPPPTK